MFDVDRVVLADATKSWPLPDESIDAIITSPPYWHHRDNGPATTTVFSTNSQCSHEWDDIKSDKNGFFCKKCGAWKGQLGQEPNPADYIRHLVDIFDVNASRVLKPTGQLWVNLGDCFSNEGISGWIQKKQKLYLPARFAVAMQDKGWIMRNDIIWAKSVVFSDKSSKGGSMPSSIHSRFNGTHEYFFFFVKPLLRQRPYYTDLSEGIVSWLKEPGGEWKARNYYSCLDDVRIKQLWVDASGKRIDFYGRRMGSRPNAGGSPKQHAAGQPHLYMDNHPLGKNPGTVWQFNTEPFEGQHNSPYPPKLIQWIIRFSCPQWVCSKCGLPQESYFVRKNESVRLARCRCGSELKSGIVLDPFMGSGSTAIAALRERRHYFGMELNPDYVRICEKRLSDELSQRELPSGQDVISNEDKQYVKSSVAKR